MSKRRAGKGSHGSLTKAGKVRGSTPKVERRYRVRPGPKLKRKQTYLKRKQGKELGQPSEAQRRRRKRTRREW